jgi:hypothetical protein
MRKLLTILALALLGSASAWASISAVGTGAKGNNTGTGTGVTLAYTPTTGNVVIIYLATSSGTSPSCTDGTTTLTAGPTVAPFSSWYLSSATASHTAFACSWTGSVAWNATLQEYSGNTGGINAALTGNTATGFSATASITVTTQDANDWVVCGLSDSANTITATVGTSRVQSTLGSDRITVLDNTVASAGSVTCTGTVTSTSWSAAAIELRLNAAAPGGGFNKRRKLARLGVFN